MLRTSYTYTHKQLTADRQHQKSRSTLQLSDSIL